MQNNNPAVQFIRNFTVEPIGKALADRAREAGLNPIISYGAYDNTIPEILAVADSSQPPALLIVALDIEFLSGGIYNPKWELEQAKSELTALLKTLEAIPSTTFVLLTTFLPPFRSSLPWVPDHPVLGRGAAAFALNQILREYAGEHSSRCGLLDFERIAAKLGESASIDRRFGLMMKAPFREPFVQAAADEIMRYLRCQFTPSKKVIILDCDNTLWGGVVGECGVDGIQLDPYEYPGIAYYRFQFEALSLMEQGVLLCICSKNDESAVWEVMDRHPHCLIKRRHLAAYRVNWEDKASNIKNLAEELGLSPDSMVFIDDNPAECELIRASFPILSVLQVPAKIYNYPGLLQSTGWFDRVSLSHEDKARTGYYQAERGRREIQKQLVDAESFLRDLQMRATIRPLKSDDVPRAAQLCQRTNQFNLTTKRYTGADLENLRHDPAARIYVLQAEDRFGDIGLSGLIIYRKQERHVDVDTFLLSCRIIGRKFDQALFCESLRLLKGEWDFDELQASYIPTLKNNVVSKLWDEYGFTRRPEAASNVYSTRTDALSVKHPSTIQINEEQ